MKSYFLRLFDYDHYANGIMVDLISKGNNPAAPVKLMTHLLSSQQVWFHRCAGLQGDAPAIWPEGEPDNFAILIDSARQLWIEFFSDLDENDFEKEIAYKNSRGEAFTNSLVDILGHVINHGTHHRAQIGQQLKAEGIELPFTDYIIYVRNLNS